uniref:Uncharacterized protein n=1 Tax=Oryza meridionalis TaxID=40149 RepID=A0A0E0CK19_9ORYZ
MMPSPLPNGRSLGTSTSPRELWSAATPSSTRSCSRRLEANPAELQRHQLRLTILSKTPQESLRTVQRGGRSTTVFSNSDLAPPSSNPIQPERIPVMSYVSCVVIALPRAARAMSDLLQLGSCPIGLP